MLYANGVEQMAKRITKDKPSSKAKPGPKPDVLKINGNWEDVVKKSLGKKKPATGWPK